jgi:hypothetical protein
VSQARDRDTAVEQWLRHLSTQGMDAPASAECLDPEVMAAWIDGRLAGASLADAETHVAGCARCQAIAATIARTESIAEWSAPEQRPRWRWLTWVVPLSAAATVAAVIFVVRNERGQSPSSAVVPQVAESRPGAPPAERETAQRPEAKNENALAKRDQGKSGAVREEDSKALRDKAPARQSTDAFDAVAPKKPAPAAPVAAPPAGAVTSQKPSTQIRADESARTAELRAQQAAIGIEIRSPDPAVRWRIGRVSQEQVQGFARSATVVERSIDSGSTWTPSSTGVTTEITAGAAPSASVCWLVARAGVVLLTTNGTAWQRVTFPEATDLSAVRATDARTATVTTADGREFSTDDGGRTWVRRSLQESETASF